MTVVAATRYLLGRARRQIHQTSPGQGNDYGRDLMNANAIKKLQYSLFLRPP